MATYGSATISSAALVVLLRATFNSGISFFIGDPVILARLFQYAVNLGSDAKRAEFCER
jgi:hypothetical protein